jgi:Fe-S-cluster containining protein
MLPQLRSKPRRDQLAPGECLCDHCVAKCCRYFALPIDTPKTRGDYDTVRWFLLHEHTAIFLEDGDWYLLVHTRCRHLQPDQRCGIYETRPQICRDYSTKDCEYDDEWTYEQYFETPGQLEEYAEAVLPPRKGRGIRSPKPAGLPLLRTVPPAAVSLIAETVMP